jgi:predicted XRE-type DNA-binding protein
MKRNLASETAAAVTRSSGNVYADLGMKDADWMLVKAGLASTIARIVASRRLSHVRAAELLDLTQPQLANLLRGHFHRLSERRLMDCLARLGRDVQIVVKATPRSRGLGRLSVLVM